MKKLLLSTLAFFMTFTSLGINAFAKENSAPVDDVPHIIIDAEGKTLEELFDTSAPYQVSLETELQPRGATDEYYQLLKI